MKLSALSFAISVAFVNAKEINLVDGSLTTNSEIGRNLLSKARQLEQNNNYYYWIKDYSIKFVGCASVPQFERENGFTSNLLAKFRLCPSDSCSASCANGGDYIVDMRDFVEAYQNAQQQANEYTCQTAKETCEYQCQNGYYQYNGNANYNYNNNGQNGQNGQNQDQNQNNNNQNYEEMCQYSCLNDQNLGYCADDQQDDQGRDMNELTECRPINEGNRNNNNNNYYSNSYQMYYVGAYCTSSGVYAETFTDSACTKRAPSGTYEKYNYGYSLPTKPLVSSSGCLSCKQQYNNNNDNNNNNNNNYAISEACQQMYQQAAKCETNIKGTNYQDTSGCELINTIVPRLNAAFNGLTGRGAPRAATAIAWTLGFACSFMAVYIYWLHRKVIRQKVDLANLGYPDKGISA